MAYNCQKPSLFENGNNPNPQKEQNEKKKSKNNNFGGTIRRFASAYSAERFYFLRVAKENIPQPDRRAKGKNHRKSV